MRPGKAKTGSNWFFGLLGYSNVASAGLRRAPGGDRGCSVVTFRGFRLCVIWLNTVLGDPQ